MSDICTKGLTSCEEFNLPLLRAKAKQYGVSRLAKDCGLRREVVSRALREGSNPRIRTLWPIMTRLFELHIHYISPVAAPGREGEKP